MALPLNKTHFKRLEQIQNFCVKQAFYRSGQHDYLEFCRTELLDSIENRRKINIIQLLQKLKLNQICIPQNWLSHMQFLEQLPTGRHGLKLECAIRDQKIFYNFASKIFNESNQNLRDCYTTNKKLINTLI